MAKGPIYRTPLRRRREGKTNYYKRRELLKSENTRVVIRRSTKHMRVQFISAFPDGDKTLSYTSSTQLKDFKWNVSCGNIPAAYLTGYLAGKQAQKSGIENAILDLGLQSNTHGSRIYATLKGLIDAGIEIPANDKIFPSDDVLHGSHIKTISEQVKNEDEKSFKKVYAKYQSNKINPSKISDLVSSSMEAIDKL